MLSPSVSGGRVVLGAAEESLRHHRRLETESGCVPHTYTHYSYIPYNNNVYTTLSIVIFGTFESYVCIYCMHVCIMSTVYIYSLHSMTAYNVSFPEKRV
jgi:hypothetical protein